MPGFMTHYTVGTKFQKKIPDGFVYNSIKKNQKVYNLGLQGPDIFFYFIPYKLINKKNLGSLLHRNKIKEFFISSVNYIVKCRNIEEKEIMIAYISGFYAHFCLDKNCHPYIYYKSGYMYIDKNYHEKHVNLESDIDYIFTKKILGKNYSDLNFKKFVDLNKRQRKVVACLLDKICNKLFKNILLNNKIAELVIINFCYLINFFNDKTGEKYKVISRIERKLTNANNLSALFVGDNYKFHYIDSMNKSKSIWFNPWAEQEKKSDSFIELCNKAELEFLTFMEILDKCVKEENVIELKKHMKNYSYLSGLEIK